MKSSNKAKGRIRRIMAGMTKEDRHSYLEMLLIFYCEAVEFSKKADQKITPGPEMPFQWRN